MATAIMALIRATAMALRATATPIRATAITITATLTQAMVIQTMGNTGHTGIDITGTMSAMKTTATGTEAVYSSSKR